MEPATMINILKTEVKLSQTEQSTKKKEGKNDRITGAKMKMVIETEQEQTEKSRYHPGKEIQK